jgi:hypothetical protein
MNPWPVHCTYEGRCVFAPTRSVRARQYGAMIVPIVLPALSERAHELDRIVDAYARDAATPLTAANRASIQRHESQTLADIETATQRYVANGLYGTTRAAELLGLSHSTLSEWPARRTLEILPAIIALTVETTTVITTPEQLQRVGAR